MKFILNKDVLEIEDCDVENSGSINYYENEIEYDSSWNGLIIEAVIKEQDEEKGKERLVVDKKIYTDQKNDGRYRIGFKGYKIENGEKVYQISTNLERLPFIQGAGEIPTETEELPKPTEWELYLAQIQKMIDEIPKSNGGESGYTGEEIDPTVPNHVKKITEKDIEKWNNKAEKSEIPDTSKFITNSVNDLLNYYLKSESYSKEEVNNLIGQIKTISIQKVDELPEVGESNIIYLIQKEGSENDVHNEYIYINNKWELIGSTQIDLTGYATEEWVNIKIKDFLNESQVNNLISVALLDHYTKEQINTLLKDKADSTDIPTKLSDLDNDKKYQTETEVQALINNAIGTVLAGEY